jgi:hypothetical protein
MRDSTTRRDPLLMASATLPGPRQFLRKLRSPRPSRHRITGRVCLVADPAIDFRAGRRLTGRLLIDGGTQRSIENDSRLRS